MRGEVHKVRTPKTIHVEPGSQLDRALEAAGDAPVELERRGVRYRLNRVGAPVSSAPPPTPEQVARSIAGIREAAGGWQGLVDADSFTSYIRERRRTANRPSVSL